MVKKLSTREQIELFLIKNSITQAELCARLRDVDEKKRVFQLSTLNRVVTGGCPIPRMWIAPMAKVLGVEVERLIEGR